MKHVTVVGGGVIGLSVGWALQRRGVAVTILDARRPGAAASSGNAGWVVPSLAGPVPVPGLLTTSFRWLLKPDGPLYVKPRLSLEFVRWLFGFWKACSPSAFERGLAATYALSGKSLQWFDHLRDESVSFEMHDQGTLFVYRSSSSRDADLRYFEQLGRCGFPAPRELSPADTQDLEPTLVSNIAGSLFVPGDRLVRPESLVAGLVAALDAGGAEIVTGEPVTDIEHSHGIVRSVSTPTRCLETDAVVVAAGVWSRDVARLAGVKVMMEAGKGYSVDYVDPPVLPTHALYLHDERVAISPYQGTLRLAGGMELAGLDERLNHRRIATIEREAAALFREWPGVYRQPDRIWTGMRPMTPDGLPLIGLAPGFRNLALATGHAMLGVTLAPATGIEVAELLLTGTASDLIKPFDPARARR